MFSYNLTWSNQQSVSTIGELTYKARARPKPLQTLSNVFVREMEDETFNATVPSMYLACRVDPVCEDVNDTLKVKKRGHSGRVLLRVH